MTFNSHCVVKIGRNSSHQIPPTMQSHFKVTSLTLTSSFFIPSTCQPVSPSAPPPLRPLHLRLSPVRPISHLVSASCKHIPSPTQWYPALNTQTRYMYKHGKQSTNLWLPSLKDLYNSLRHHIIPLPAPTRRTDPAQF